MAEDLYAIRKRYREQSRQREREFSGSALEAAGEAVDTVLSAPKRALKRSISGNPETFGLPDFSFDVNVGNRAGYRGTATITDEIAEGALDVVADPVNLMGAGAVTNVMRAAPRNVRTMIPGFYKGPVEQAKGVTQEAARALPYAVQEALSPTAAATAREFGTGAGRRAEMINPVDEKGKLSESVRKGNIMASPYMLQQSRGAAGKFGNTVSEAMPTFRSEVASTGNMADDAALKKVLAQNEDIPDDVMDRAMNHVRGVHSGTGTVVGRRRAASGSQLGAEAAGTAKGTAPEVAKMLSNPKLLSAFKEYAGDQLNEKELREYLGIVNAITQSAGRTKTGKRTLSDIFYQGEEGTSLRSTYLAETYWKAKARQAKGQKIRAGGPQEEALAFVNKYIAENPITIKDMDGKLVLQQSFRSSAKDLGGMNAFVVVDPKGGEFYTMLSDGHDLFGMTPPGWSDLTTVLPIQRRRLGDQDMPRGSLAENRAAKRTRESAVAGLERASGMQIMKGESVKAFEDRVARDFRATPTREENIRALSNQIGVAGMLTGGNREEERR